MSWSSRATSWWGKATWPFRSPIRSICTPANNPISVRFDRRFLLPGLMWNHVNGRSRSLRLRLATRSKRSSKSEPATAMRTRDTTGRLGVAA